MFSLATFAVFTILIGGPLGNCLLATASDEEEDGLAKVNPVEAWVNSIPFLRTWDTSLHTMLEDMMKTPMNDKEIVNAFYKFVGLPMQTQCTVGQWLGRTTVSSYHQICKNGKSRK